MSVQNIMTNDKTGNELVIFAQETAKRLKRDDLKRTQIRNIFTEARKIEPMWEHEPERAIKRLNLLKPKLAYQSKRHPEVAYLEQVLSESITHVDKAAKESFEHGKQKFEVFMDLFEAILAYHYYEGGKK